MPRLWRTRRNRRNYDCRRNSPESCGKDASNRNRIKGLKNNWIYDPVNKKFITLWEALCKGLPYGKIHRRREQNRRVTANIAKRLSGQKRLADHREVVWHVTIYASEAGIWRNINHKQPTLVDISVCLISRKAHKRYRNTRIDIPGTRIPSREEVERLVMKAALDLVREEQVERIRHEGHRFR